KSADGRHCEKECEEICRQKCRHSTYDIPTVIGSGIFLSMQLERKGKKEKAMPKSASVVNTWDAVIRATDASIEELSMQMYREPKNATMYQQSITILMLRKQEAIIRKK